MSGEQLYAAWCAALFVDWPKPGRPYRQIFDSLPNAPVAWPFLHELQQKGWNNLAEALSNPVES